VDNKSCAARGTVKGIKAIGGGEEHGENKEEHHTSRTQKQLVVNDVYYSGYNDIDQHYDRKIYTALS
jgi:hypothetical protein